MFFDFHYFAREGPVPPKATTGMTRDATKMPPAPQLEETPIEDIQREREAEDKILNSYAWIDKSQGIVRIPIDQAIDLLAQKSLPARPGNGPQSASTAIVPAESGLGPKSCNSPEVLWRRCEMKNYCLPSFWPAPLPSRSLATRASQPSTACRIRT